MIRKLELRGPGGMGLKSKGEINFKERLGWSKVGSAHESGCRYPIPGWPKKKKK